MENESIELFLESIGEGRYKDLFKENEIELDLLMQLSENHLTETLTKLGLKLGTQMKILEKIESVKKKDKVSCTASDVSAQGIADLQITNKAEDRRERKSNDQSVACAQRAADPLHGHEAARPKMTYVDSAGSFYSQERFSIGHKEIRIVLLGITGCGKSATGNSLLGYPAFESYLSLTSVTQGCSHRSAVRFNHNILVVDTPGIFDTEVDNEHIQQEISKCIGLSSPGPHVFILVMASTSRFTEEEERTVKLFERQFGEGIYRHFIIVFTRKEDMDRSKMDLMSFVQKSPAKLVSFIQKCGGRVFTVNNTLEGEESEIQAQKLLGEILKTVEMNGGECYTNEIYKAAERKLQEYEKEEKRRNEVERQKAFKDIEDSVGKKYKKMIEEEKKKLSELQNALHRELEKVKNISITDEQKIEKLQKANEESKKKCEMLLKESREEEEKARLDYEMKEREDARERARLEIEKESNFYSAIEGIFNFGSVALVVAALME